MRGFGKVILLCTLLLLSAGCVSTEVSTPRNLEDAFDDVEMSSFAILSIGARNDPDFLAEILDTFIQQQGGYVFPSIISNNISHLYLRQLPSGNSEIVIDVTISHWFLDGLIDSLLPKRVTPGGITFYEFSGSAIVLNSAGIIMLPVRDLYDPSYTYIEPIRGYPSNRYMSLESDNRSSLEKGHAISYQITRTGRQKYKVEGVAEFDSPSAARSSMTSLRLKLAKDFSRKLSEGVSLEGTDVKIYHDSLTRKEAIDLILYMGNV